MNRRSDKDAGDGLVALYASQSTALHYTSYSLDPSGREGKEDNREIRSAAILEADVKEMEYSWRQLDHGDVGWGSECLAESCWWLMPQEGRRRLVDDDVLNALTIVKKDTAPGASS